MDRGQPRPLARRPLARRAVLLGLGVAAGLVLQPHPAQALTLAEARAQGLVGEMPNGYVGVVRNGPGVSQLVEAVNAQRRQRYQDLARSHNVPLAAVERQAGERLIGRLNPGEHYADESGRWRRR